MEHVGGLDTYLLNQSDKVLSKRALEAKKKIQSLLRKKASAQKAAAKPAAAKKAAKKTTSK
jgi:hypothetical protein